MKKVVLAEKPSVARELARVLGCRIREKGYIEGSEYVVTWALGHLVELAQPAQYSDRYKRWSLSDLPMLPEHLKHQVIEESREQFDIVSSLLVRPDIESLVIATDAGREGELVARWIMEEAGYHGKAMRLWISSQTDSAITEGFANLKASELYDNLFLAAESRAAADWYVGMNVTRALTCHYDAKLSAGRVQTPTLALMTDREDEIDRFVGTFYWTIKADFTSFSASLVDKEGSTHINTEQEALALEKTLPGSSGKVVELQTNVMEEHPPLAYDLTELQRDANIYLDFSAKMTLDTLQKLYEIHKIVTYPRTDSRYITHDIVATLPQRLKALESTPFGTLATKYVNEGFRVDEERFVQDLAVTDHHALLPTEQPVNLDKLNRDERALWELVVIRFLEVLSPDYQYQTTMLKAQVGDSYFQTRLTIPQNQGWRDVARIIKRRSAAVSLDLDDDYQGGLSRLSLGDNLTISSVKVRKMSTSAPQRYTDATLLSAMEHAGRMVDDVQVKKHLGNGLGTPATRADIIEKLVQNHYVDRQGKELVPTSKGRELVRLVPLQLRSAELTGKWESRLSAIAEGEEDPSEFLTDIKQNARALVGAVVHSNEVFSPVFKESKQCPYCHGPMMKVVDELGQIHYVCQKLSCSYEEMEVKKRIKVPESLKVAVPVPAAKKVVVIRKAVSATATADGLKKLVIKKKPMVSFSLPDEKEEKAATYSYVTETVVVHPSKKAWHENTNARPRQEDRPWGQRGNKDAHLVNDSDSLSSGGTFADFLKASEDRRKKERKK